MLLSFGYIALGVLGGYAFVMIARRTPERTLRLLAHALIIASFIYVAFAMASMENAWLAVEIVGVLIFVGFAWLGLRRSLSWLWLGWALHIVWDVGLHLGADAAFVPFWYPMICVGFDAMVAFHVFRMQRFRPLTAGVSG